MLGKEIKVLFNSYPQIGQNYGGLQIQIDNTKRSLEKAGCIVKLFDSWNDKIEDYDIFHTFYLGDVGASTLLEIAKKRGVHTVVSTVYNSALDLNKERFYYMLSKIHPTISFMKYTERKTVENTDYFIVLSDVEKDMLKRIYSIPLEKFFVIPNGVSDSFLSSTKNVENSFVKEYGIQDFVLHVGQFNSNKNQFSLIKAMKGTGIPLVCIGQVTDSNYFNKCQEISDENILLLSPVNNDSQRLLEIYQAAKLFVLPSKKEAYPITVLEALINGNRVLLTRNSMFGNKYDEYGVDRTDPKDINAIRKWVLSNIDKEKLMFPDVLRHELSWDYVAKLIKEVYEKALME